MGYTDYATMLAEEAVERLEREDAAAIDDEEVCDTCEYEIRDGECECTALARTARWRRSIALGITRINAGW